MVKARDIVLVVIACALFIAAGVMAGMSMNGEWFKSSAIDNAVLEVGGNVSLSEFCTYGSIAGINLAGCVDRKTACGRDDFALNFSQAEDKPICFTLQAGYLNRTALITSEALFAVSVLFTLFALLFCKKLFRALAPICTVAALIFLLVGFFIMQNGVTNINANIKNIFHTSQIEMVLATKPIFEFVSIGLGLFGSAASD